MTMPDKKSEPGKQSDATASRKQDANTMIAQRLRGYYDSIIDEGTPPHYAR